MVRGQAAVLEPDTDVQDEMGTEAHYTPKAVYNIAYPQEAILVKANSSDAQLDKYAKFEAGVFLCLDQETEDALSKVGYLYWEDPDMREPRACPHCRWSARNLNAVFAHIATHQVDNL